MKQYLEEQRNTRKHARYMAVLSVFTASGIFYVHEGIGEAHGVTFWSFLVTVLCAIFHLVRYASQDAHCRTIQAIVSNGSINNTEAEQDGASDR